MMRLFAGELGQEARKSDEDGTERRVQGMKGDGG